MKKILRWFSVLLILINLVSCNSKNEIKEKLIHCFQKETTQYNKIEGKYVNNIYLPNKFEFDDEGYIDIKINWRCNNDNLNIIWKYFDDYKYSIFGKKLLFNCYEIVVNNYYNESKNYTLFADFLYKGISYSQSFNITIGDRIDYYISNMENWIFREDKLSYLYESKVEENGKWQGAPDVTITTLIGEYNLNTNVFEYYNNWKKYYYPADKAIYNNHRYVYNVLTKELIFDGVNISMLRIYSEDEYNQYISEGVECCYLDTFFNRIKELDDFFNFIGEQDKISILYGTDYKYQTFFSLKQNEINYIL